MARSGRDRFLRRRRPQAARGGDDRISALSDDLLIIILRRLDTRTALRVGLLSRRWACLTRELPAFDFRVGDILPPRYHRWIRLHREVRDTMVTSGIHYYRLGTAVKAVMPHIRRYERRAMRALTSSVESFLGAAADDVGRRVSGLRLEFFATDNTSCINRLIAKAIDACGVDNLEAVAKQIYWTSPTEHAFPSHGLCEEPQASRLRSLKLGGCVLPPLHQHSALTVLILQDIPSSTPEAAYEGVFTSCPQLQVLHLISCGCSGIGDMVVDAPRSEIRELVVEEGGFTRIGLRALPRLESLAALGTRVGTLVRFASASFPCLRRYNITLSLGVREESIRRNFAPRMKLKLGLFLGCTPDITDLVIRFSGPDRWIAPYSSSPPPPLLPNLRRLLVADVPWSWDVSWPRLLLENAPSLETFHIHIAAPCQEEEAEPRGEEIPWEEQEQTNTMLGHHHLKEFVMAGFEGTERQVYLVRFVMGVCSTPLRHVAMFKKGYARDKGHWDWEMVTQQQHSQWTDEEKEKTLKQITDGIPSSNAPSVQLVFG